MAENQRISMKNGQNGLSVMSVLKRAVVFSLVISGYLWFPTPLPAVVKFERISIDQGLSQSSVFAIIQDKKGFLWFGTEDGLNRCDGYNFKVYRHDPDDPGSLSNNVVRAICQDREGGIWIGTEVGLNRFDREKERFSHGVEWPGANFLNDLNILTIYEDKTGVLWIGTRGAGLIGLDPGKKEFKIYKNIPGDSSSLGDNNVKAIYEDPSGVLWIGAEAGGLNKFAKKEGKFSRGPGNGNIRAICKDSSGTLWLGTANGLNRYDRGKMISIPWEKDVKNPGGLLGAYINCIYEDDEKNLWVGAYGGGLFRRDRGKQVFNQWQYRPEIPSSLGNNFVHSIFQDKGGILWIGAEAGLSKYDRGKEKFSCRDNECSDPDTQGIKQVWAFLQDEDKSLWVGTDNGLARVGRDAGNYTSWTHDPARPGSLSNNRVHAVYKDREGTLWLGTHGGGLNRFDPRTGIFSHYKKNDPDPFSLSDNIVYTMLEDRTGALWIGTNSGLNRLDRKMRRFTHWRHDPNVPGSLSNDVIYSLYEDRAGTLWIGTETGLNRFERDSNAFTHWGKKQEDSPGIGISDNLVFCIYEDKTGVLWVGTGWGLNKFDRDNRIFTYYTRKNGLPNDRIYGILEDDDGRLWLSTNGGLSRFEPRTGKCRNYDAQDGLQGNEFNGGASYKSPDGEMFFGGVNGYNRFYPGKITDNPHHPPIVITDFLVFNESVKIDAGDRDAGLLKKSISETAAIVLSYKDYLFAFEFAALDFAVPMKNRYRYKMEGFDKDWIKRDARKRFAPYTNLAPGQYIFRVIGSNNDGTWNEDGTSIRITITPPIWQQWWFRPLAGFFLILCIIGAYLWRTRLLRKKLAEQVRVQKLLQQSRDEMEISRDLLEFRNAENDKLLSAISSILIAVDGEGKVSQWSEPAAAFFGMTPAEVKGLLFADLLKDYIAADKLQEILQAGLHRDKPSINSEIPVHFEKPGETRLLLANINPIMDKSRKKFGFLLLAEDITHRKREEMLRDISQKLEALGQMAAGIAHEIRSPLQFIGDNGRFLLEAFDSLTGYCLEVRELVKEGEKSGAKMDVEKLRRRLDEGDFDFYLGEIPKAAEQIVSGVARMSQIVKSINEFAYTGNDVEEKFHLEELLKSTLVVAQSRVLKAAELETDYAPDLPAIRCGIGELNQVFLNLLLNAADAVAETGRRGFIKIVTRRQGDEVVVEIADNGVGIPDENKSKIFTPFFTTKEVGKGTGQGLYFSYRIIVEKHKGKLYFKSKVAEGTTFYVHLPVDDEEKAANIQV